MPGLPVKFLSFLLLACALQPAQAQSYACTGDCPDYATGYKWAAEKNVVLTDDCNNPSRAFMEGCFAWVEEQQGEAQSPASETPIEAVEPPENGYYE